MNGAFGSGSEAADCLCTVQLISEIRSGHTLRFWGGDKPWFWDSKLTSRYRTFSLRELTVDACPKDINMTNKRLTTVTAFGGKLSCLQNAVRKHRTLTLRENHRNELM